MAAYAISHAETATYNTPDEALNALEALIEALATSKVLYLVDILPVGDMWKGILIRTA